MIARLNAAVAGALSDAQVRTRFADLGQDIYQADRRTSEALGAFHDAEVTKWWPIIKAAGIRAE